MREIIKKATTFTKIEFWALTTIFAFAIFFFMMEGLNNDQPPFPIASYYPFFEAENVPFHFFKNYFFPQLARYIGVYIALISLNFIIVPGLLKRVSWLRNLIMLLLVFGALALLFGITATWIHGYRYASTPKEQVDAWIFSNALADVWDIIWQLIIYTGIKYAGVYLLAISGKIEVQYKWIRKEAIVAAGIWMAGLLFLRFDRAEERIIAGWGHSWQTGAVWRGPRDPQNPPGKRLRPSPR